jgi:hypothetical protein
VARRPPVSEMRQHIVTLWGGEDEFIEWCARPSKGLGVARRGRRHNPHSADQSGEHSEVSGQAETSEPFSIVCCHGNVLPLKMYKENAVYTIGSDRQVI